MSKSNEPWRERWNRGRLLGSGGQGQTFIVTSIADGQIGVLKILQTRRQRDIRSRRRMHLEVTNLSVLSSIDDSVPKVLDGNTNLYEDVETPLYFVMDLVPGPTLAEMVDSSAKLSFSDALTLVKRLARTLKAAFSEGLVHRDIKPENIIVRDSNFGAPAIVDFGLSFNEAEDGATETNEAFDNYFLSLPERRGPDENRRDPRSDLTGICAIFLFCLNGCRPRDLRDSSGRAPHRRPSFLLDTIVSPNLLGVTNALFDRGFQVELAMRFQTIDELLSRLEELEIAPSNEESVESLTTIAKRESERLFQTDRKTRLAEHRRFAQAIARTYDFASEEAARQLGPADKFRFAASRSGMTEPKNPDDPTPLAGNATFTLSYARHPHQYFVFYRLIVNGEEASLERKLARSPRGTGQRIPEGLSNWESILRYDAMTEPPPDAVTADLIRSLKNLLPMLSADIQGT